jgi:membrane protease YdiL (CAAX protease family)
MTKQLSKPIAEFFLLFVLMPLTFYFCGNRWNVPLALWGAALYATYRLQSMCSVSWKEIWQGAGWKDNQKKAAFVRFCMAAPILTLLTYQLVPSHMLSLPLHKPLFWLLIMALYPLLSVLPQELLFRSFFFRRYTALFPEGWPMIIASGLAFSFMHIVFHNGISPALCIVGGGLFAYSYSQHRSLKWAIIEHAIYGCFVFTIGIGSYFVIGNMARI